MSTEIVSMPSPTGVPASGWGKNPCHGFYHAPSGKATKVAAIATHPNFDFSEHYLAPLLNDRGIGFLGWNTKFQGDEAHFLLDHAIADIGAGVRWLLDVAGVNAVVLIGNSGGGSLMAAYQAQTGGVTLTPAPGLRLCRGLEDLRPANLYVSLAAHPGRAHLFADSMDPSITDESDPSSVDAVLDMYNVANGPPYSADFQDLYRAAQRERNNRISDWALLELDRLASSGSPASDKLFVVYRLWADLRFMDGSIDPNSRQVPSCWAGDPYRSNYRTFGIGQVASLRTWLNMWSLEHSPFVAEQHLPAIKIPGLVINADGDTGIFPRDAQTIHDLLGSDDKTMINLPGNHYFADVPGAREKVADAIASWVQAHI